MDKIEKKVSRGNTGTLTTIASCAIIGVFSAMCASHLAKPFYSMMMKADQITMSGAWKNALACVLGAVIMFVLTKVANKKEIGWVKRMVPDDHNSWGNDHHSISLSRRKIR